MLSTMGEGRSSYSKTDPDATFMRMKEDHMRNGQLKPGYNVQIAVNSEYITGLEAYSDRNDVRTLRPMLEKYAGEAVSMAPGPLRGSGGGCRV